jgi:hypothetical protein
MTTSVAQSDPSAQHSLPRVLVVVQAVWRLWVSLISERNDSQLPFVGGVLGALATVLGLGACVGVPSALASVVVFAAIAIALALFSPEPRLLQFRNITAVAWVYTLVGGLLILI